MKIHEIELKPLNEFFENGFKLLEKLEQSSSPHAEQNANTMMLAMGDAWLKAADKIGNPLIIMEP